MRSFSEVKVHNQCFKKILLEEIILLILHTISFLSNSGI